LSEEFKKKMLVYMGLIRQGLEDKSEGLLNKFDRMEKKLDAIQANTDFLNEYKTRKTYRGKAARIQNPEFSLSIDITRFQHKSLQKKQTYLEELHKNKHGKKGFINTFKEYVIQLACQ